MKKLNVLSLLISTASLICVMVLFFSEDNKKTAFFQSAEVYNQFDYKIELEHELSLVQEKVYTSIDSLERDLQLSLEYLKSVTPTEDEIILFERKQQYYLEIKNSEEQLYLETQQQYYGLIWDRLNGYIREFGQENDYVYIFGANGDGSVMYADDTENITTELIAFVNSKYAGE